MSKAALCTFDEVLREELRLSGDSGISVCTVLPTGVDTPFFRHAANRSGRVLRSLPPVATPERIARASCGPPAGPATGCSSARTPACSSSPVRRLPRW